ncbi:oxidoreductase, partial [Limosilactobacillus fermentum]|nr:oxidoreductase [Limosilactobacillus fermentum]
MQNPLITAVIPGAKQPDQVIQNAAALQLELTSSEYQIIEEAFAGFK